MFFKVMLLTIILTQVSSSTVAEEDYYKHNSYDDYDDYEYDFLEEGRNKPTEATTKQANNATKGGQTTEGDKPQSTTDKDELTYILTQKPDSNTNSESDSGYEVTEIIDDIPNPVTFKPIQTNFIIKPPLNNATGIINSNENSQPTKNDNNSRPKKNSINIFHVSAEFDNDKEQKPVIQNINIHKIPFGIFKVKDHVEKLTEDVLNHIHSTEGYYEGAETGAYFPHVLQATSNFFNKIKDKSSQLYTRFKQSRWNVF